MEKAFEKLLKKYPSPNTARSETIGVRYESEVTDVIHYKDGRVETVNLGHNVMLNSFIPLITDLLVNGGDRQLKYWAVGAGEENWDTEPKPEKVTITITDPCETAGTVKITLSGVTYSVSVQAGATAVQVAQAISGINFDTSERVWVASTIDNAVTFVADVNENLPNTHSYDPNGTGAYGSVSIIEGSKEIVRPTPQPTQIKLVNEVYRKPIIKNEAYPNDGIHFLTDSGSISASPTNILEIQLTFGYDEGFLNSSDTESKWREFSIVGGNSATEELNTGYFMNVKNHACITKTRSMLVERKIKFTFENADNSAD